jgi:hypothetical protein
VPLALVTSALVLLIHLQLLPAAVQAVLRDWVLHAVAVFSASLWTSLAIGARAPGEGVRRARIAIAGLVPLAVVALHELGQWLWPAGARDAFDAVRDLGLDGLGALLAWLWLARR